jgi:predicted lipid-binding transport protein (Tim44 family)
MKSHPTAIAALRSNAARHFDESVFVERAKEYFIRMQKAWDIGNLADIREFTSDHVFSDIRDQFHTRSAHGETEITSLEAQLLSSDGSANRQEAIVLFRGELRVNGNAHLIEEVWDFVRQPHTSWLLDGIQQVEG